MKIGKVISSIKEKGYLMIKILGLGVSDVRTLYSASNFGIDSNPNANYRAIYVDTDDKRDKVCVGYINKKAIAENGELRLYSEKSDNSESFYIYLKKDGKCEIGGNTDNLVRYSKLEEGFNTLKSELNSAITIFNSHVHPVIAVGSPTGATATPQTSATATVTAAKINEIKTL